jgi:hypothetical protein
VDAQEIDFVFQSNGDHVRLEDASFTASKTSPGELRVGKVTINQPWLRRTFRNVTGKTALQGDRLALAHVVLEPDVELRNLTASPSDLARGKLDLETDVAAFDGTLRVEASTHPEGGRGVVFDASGTFGGINIAKLASFLALSEAAGGVIKDGKLLSAARHTILVAPRRPFDWKRSISNGRRVSGTRSPLARCCSIGDCRSRSSIFGRIKTNCI